MKETTKNTPRLPNVIREEMVDLAKLVQAEDEFNKKHKSIDVGDSTHRLRLDSCKDELKHSLEVHGEYEEITEHEILDFLNENYPNYEYRLVKPYEENTFGFLNSTYVNLTLYISDYEFSVYQSASYYKIMTSLPVRIDEVPIGEGSNTFDYLRDDTKPLDKCINQCKIASALFNKVDGRVYDFIEEVDDNVIHINFGLDMKFIYQIDDKKLHLVRNLTDSIRGIINNMTLENMDSQIEKLKEERDKIISYIEEEESFITQLLIDGGVLQS